MAPACLDLRNAGLPWFLKNNSCLQMEMKTVLDMYEILVSFIVVCFDGQNK